MAGWTWTAGPLIFGSKWKRREFSKPSGAKDQAKNPLAKEATLLTLYVLLVLHTYVYIYMCNNTWNLFVLTVVVCQCCYVHVFVYSFVYFLNKTYTMYLFICRQRPRTAVLRGATQRGKGTRFLLGKAAAKRWFLQRVDKLDPNQENRGGSVDILSYLVIVIVLNCSTSCTYSQ